MCGVGRRVKTSIPTLSLCTQRDYTRHSKHAFAPTPGSPGEASQTNYMRLGGEVGSGEAMPSGLINIIELYELYCYAIFS